MALACFSVLKSLIHLLFQAHIFTVFSSKKQNLQFQSIFGREAGPQGVFELRLKKFSNLMQTDSNGLCCDGSSSQGSRMCSGLCATKFRVCLKHYMAHVDMAGMCTFGEQITPVVRNSDNLETNLQTIQFDINFKWPVSFFIMFFYEVVFLKKMLFSWQIYPCLFLLCFYNLIKSRFVFYPPCP